MKDMLTVWAAPFTVTDPDDGEAEYPETEPMVYEYVPSGTEKDVLVPVEDWVLPLKVTDHEVPLARPDSVKVTA